MEQSLPLIPHLAVGYWEGGIGEMKFKAHVQSNRTVVLRGIRCDSITERSDVLCDRDFYTETIVRGEAGQVALVDSLCQAVEKRISYCCTAHPLLKEGHM
jgi:hypothetical protein